MDDDERRRTRQAAKFPKKGIELSDFSFRIQPREIETKTRVDYLESQEVGAMRPQPFRAVADELRRKGEGSKAKALEIEWRKRSARGNRPKVPGSHPPRNLPWYRCQGYWLNRAWSALFRWTVGYGFRPGLALLWAAALISLFSVILVWAPADAFETGDDPIPPIAVLGAIETFLPVVQLGPLAKILPTATTTWGQLVGCVQAFVSIAGWILAAAFLAGVSESVRKPFS